MPKIGIIEEDPTTGEQALSGFVGEDEISQKVGFSPSEAYTDADKARRLVELVADSDNYILYGDPDMFSPEVLEVVGPYLVEADDTEAEKFYGEAEGTPAEEAPPAAAVPAAAGAAPPTAPAAIPPQDAVSTTVTEAINPATGEESVSQTSTAEVASNTTKKQLDELLSYMAERGGKSA